MKFKAKRHLVLTVILVSLPLLIFLWIKHSGNFNAIYQWSQANLYLYILVLFLLKVVAFVYPPLPGGILTLGSVPILGALTAYLVDAAGSVVGSTICYFLGQRYGFNFLNKILDQTTIEKIKNIKIKKKREIESVFAFRILGGTVVEFVAYACGILGVGFKNFLIGSVASHALVGIPTFYLAGSILTTQNVVLSVLLSVTLVYLLYKFKDRYFEL